MTPPPVRLQDVRIYLEQFAPLDLGETWDNVGLLVGDPRQTVARVMTCLTVTPASASEAVERHVDLIVSHHPLPFRALTRITTETTPGRLLWDLIGHRIAIYSPHTAFDSAAEGINQQLAERLGLTNIAPLRPSLSAGASVGAGRIGQYAAPRMVSDIARDLRALCGAQQIGGVADPNQRVTQAAIACGSGGEFLGTAIAAGCDLFVTGETSFHTCLEAESQGLALLMMGHYASERFAQESLAVRLATEFPALEVWASERERDPVIWL